MQILNLTFDQVKEELKNYTYIDLLNLCKTLDIQVIELKNEIEMQISYNKCIESILNYKKHLESKNQDLENEYDVDESRLEKSFDLTIPIKFNLVQADNSFRYFILGNTYELGNWNINNATELINSNNIYSCYVDLNIYNLENVEYKLIRLDKQNIYWENGENRKILKDENYIIWR